MRLEINNELLDLLLKEASGNERLRWNFDLRNSSEDTSQRMLNALQPGTIVPIHRHIDTSETVVCLKGRLEEIFYDEINEENTAKGIFRERERILLAPSEGKLGIQVPKAVWHSISVIEPSVIFEVKDGKYEK